MGFSAVLPGGIMLMTLLIVAAIIIPSVAITSSTMAKAYSEKALVENELLKTSFRIDSIKTSAPSSTVTMGLTNTGSTKLYNYEKFSIIVTYDSGIVVNSTTTKGPTKTESLVYSGMTNGSSSPSAAAGKWIITKITPDSLDPGIWNPGEQITISANLSNNTFSTGSISAVVSTDVGQVTTLSEAIT
jgi:archaellum component FlaF (FlaF/FlaG flagellin family)